MNYILLMFGHEENCVTAGLHRFETTMGIQLQSIVT